MSEVTQLTAPELAPSIGHGGVDGLHPAVAAWFRRRFPDGPTEAQQQGWPHIATGADTLIAAPTGSGKTLAAFLVAIDRLYREHDRGLDVSTGTRVVYVSPLKALAVDIGENLEQPLDEIADIAAELGLDSPEIRIAVRTGDTTSSQRSAMVRRPPSFVVTTPESLYLLVTSARGREVLRTTETVIVDEIHAVARDKRGAHLALTLERLEALCDKRPSRIGLSATQRPIERVGRLLVGERPLPEIVDVGHQRALDVTLELPEGELESVASAEQMSDVLNRIAEHVTQHRTTLVFVNTRRLAERLAHQLGERLGDDVVAAHHGSLSKGRRWRVETRLRAGAEARLDAPPALLGEAAVVRGDDVVTEALAELVREPLGEPTRVHEDERGPVLGDVLGDAVQHVGHLLGGRDRLELALGELECHVERALVADVDGLRQRALAHEQPSDPLDGPLRRRETNTRRSLVAQRLEPFECEREVGAALVAGDGVDLVDDHRLGRPQRLAPARARDEEIQRLGCRDHETWRTPHHGRALCARRVARAYGDADVGRVEAKLGGDLCDLGQRLLEVLDDVDGERLQWRDVHDPRPGRHVDATVVLAVQPVDRHQEGGERLARSRRRRDQRVGAGGDVGPALLLGLGGAVREPAPEPGRNGGVKTVDAPVTDRGRELGGGQLSHLAHSAARV